MDSKDNEENSNIWFVCDRCAKDICEEEDVIDEDGLLYCKDCYKKLIERGD